MTDSSFVLVGNGSYLNKGCEAIVRGTTRILRNAFGESRFYHANFDMLNPPHMPRETDKDIIHQPIAWPKRWGPKWVLHQGLIRAVPKIGWGLHFRNILSQVQQSKAVLSIGGDTYSLDYSTPALHIAIDDFAQRHGNPLVIWGASVGPFDSNPEFADAMHAHLKSTVKAIFVREKRSQQYLEKYGIVQNVYLAPDPAFVMRPEACDVSELGFALPDGAIGLNLSPLMQKKLHADTGENFLDESVSLIAGLQQRTGRPVVLIPHVTAPHSNDHSLLADIHQRLNRSDVYLVPPHLNAAQTKHIISNLACLVATRTHATIGAFSSCVPTVSLAYSVKAHGINEMLFGHQDFVVPLEEFSARSVEKKTLHALDRADEARDVLSSTMTKVTAEAMVAGEILRDVLDS